MRSELKYLSRKEFKKGLAETLQELLSQDEVDVEQVKGIPDAAKSGLEYTLDTGKAIAVELARAHARGEPEAMEQVNALLAASGRTMQDIIAGGLANQRDHMERIDRLIRIAETRRNASLREIERYRAVLSEAARRNVQEIEDAEFEVIEMTPPERARREH